MKVLGIDVGGVIISRGDGSEDTNFFSDNYLKTPPENKVFEVLNRVVPKFDDVIIISKCGRKVQEKTMAWMDYYDFYKKTGINRNAFNFCFSRAEKMPIARFWGVTHFVDDKWDVLESMVGTVPNLYLYGKNSVGQGFIPLETWETFEQKLDI